MSHLVQELLFHRVVRYAFIGAIAFALGGASAVVASNQSNAPLFRLGDATDLANVAAVDASGSLHVAQQGSVSLSVTDFPDAGTHARLDSANSSLSGINTAAGKLQFDGSSNLKVAPQGTQNVNVLGGTVNTAAPAGRLIIAMRDRDVPAHNRVEASFENVSDCRSMAVLIEQTIIGPPQLVGGLQINGDGGSFIQTLMGGTGSGSVFFFNVPGTSMPVVAPFARVFVDNTTDSPVHFGRVWLYCAH